MEKQMRVPYFLLELGDTCIFQPQNIKPNALYNVTIGRIDNLVVRSEGEPELNGSILFLNGSSRKLNYKPLLIGTKSMTIFKQIIDNHNRSLDV